MILKLMSGDFIVVRSCLPLHLIWSNIPFCNYCFESSWAFNVWSFNKIPRPVPSQIRYITDQVTRSQRWWNKDGGEDGTWGDVTDADADAGVAGLDDSLQLQAFFFPFPQSEKKTDSRWQSRENRRVTRVLPKLATCLIQRRNKILNIYI